MCSQFREKKFPDVTGKPLVLKGKERLKLKNPTKMCSRGFNE